jgi:hypothetical protein
VAESLAAPGGTLPVSQEGQREQLLQCHHDVGIVDHLGQQVVDPLQALVMRLLLQCPAHRLCDMSRQHLRRLNRFDLAELG